MIPFEGLSKEEKEDIQQQFPESETINRDLDGDEDLSDEVLDNADGKLSEDDLDELDDIDPCDRREGSRLCLGFAVLFDDLS